MTTGPRGPSGAEMDLWGQLEEMGWEQGRRGEMAGQRGPERLKGPEPHPRPGQCYWPVVASVPQSLPFIFLPPLHCWLWTWDANVMSEDQVPSSCCLMPRAELGSQRRRMDRAGKEKVFMRWGHGKNWGDSPFSFFSSC